MQRLSTNVKFISTPSPAAHTLTDTRDMHTKLSRHDILIPRLLRIDFVDCTGNKMFLATIAKSLRDTLILNTGCEGYFPVFVLHYLQGYQLPTFTFGVNSLPASRRGIPVRTP